MNRNNRLKPWDVHVARTVAKPGTCFITYWNGPYSSLQVSVTEVIYYSQYVLARLWVLRTVVAPNVCTGPHQVPLCCNMMHGGRNTTA